MREKSSTEKCNDNSLNRHQWRSFNMNNKCEPAAPFAARPGGDKLNIPTTRVPASRCLFAGLLFAFASTPVLAVDTDGDGVPDNLDNCITVSNGPDTPGITPAQIQRDTDGDGIGNLCDGDFNNDGIVGPFDLSAFRAAYGSTSSPDQDLNGDGIVGPFDLSAFRSFYGKPPGPSCTGLFYGCVAQLDPTTIPKYVTPLVIPPVMNNTGTADDYQIAMKQFKQQILPGGIWNLLNGRSDPYPATTVWSYGPAADPLPDQSALELSAGVAPAPNSQYNYPAYTIESQNGGPKPNGGYNTSPTSVRWINGLRENFGAGPNFLPHLLPIDQTLHWSNPKADCISGGPRTDCRGKNPKPYRGPVPIITHVHGGHTGPESDGYTEAWYLPDPTGSNFNCTNDPATAQNPNNPDTYVCSGSLINQLGSVTNPAPFAAGYADFTYNNDQPSTTIWYHDHALGMTRNNVYAGPAGFFLIRTPTGGEDGLVSGNLPGPAPIRGQGVLALNVPGDPVRSSIREIPIAIQDRTFNTDGSLFYPADRAFFEGLGEGFGDHELGDIDGNVAAGLNIAFIPNPSSDVSPIWNPEFFGNTTVVNGSTWPNLNVAPALYRLRLLNGNDSRFWNFALIVTDPNTGEQTTVNRTVWDDTTVPPTSSTVPTSELSFYQIGTEQGLLPQVVKVETGFATRLPGDGTVPPAKPAPDPQQALLMALAERADVIVDFRGLPNGTVVRMTNTGPDEPFGGFPTDPANPETTGQVMQFVVDNSLLGSSPTDENRAPDGTLQNPTTAATSPPSLVLGPIDAPLPNTQIVRRLAMLEEESALVCITVDGITGEINQVPGTPPNCPEGSEAFAPLAAVLGTVNQSGIPTVQMWSDPFTTNPQLNATETWQLFNFTVDAHPIHVHLVKFNVVGREAIGGGPSVVSATDPTNQGLQEWENGWKDTVAAYPGEITSVTSTFDIPGLYVWHCHIVSHEDNEMMVPYCVGSTNCGGLPLPSAATQGVFTSGLN
jgi:FtsP/CotA-like multicopper oxidase with cupredoxin domain